MFVHRVNIIRYKQEKQQGIIGKRIQSIKFSFCLLQRVQIINLNQLPYHPSNKYFMKYLTATASDAGNTASQAGLQAKKQVDWNDYNYPPCGCIKMFHYNPEQTPERFRRKTLLLKINHIAIIVALFLNLITNIIGAAQGVQMGGVRIGISVFVFFIWLPISLYLFVLPYQIMLGGKGSPLVFYILSLVAFVWFFIWSIADFADANGFVMVNKNFKDQKGAAGVFGLITSIIMMLISFLAIINGIFFYKRD